MKQKTALDMYRAKLLSVALVSNSIKDVFKNEEMYFQQAKQMEKEQITNTYLNACARVTPYGYYNDSAEQYYNETYGSNNQI